jgi:hypothetical protein
VLKSVTSPAPPKSGAPGVVLGPEKPPEKFGGVTVVSYGGKKKVMPFSDANNNSPRRRRLTGVIVTTIWDGG